MARTEDFTLTPHELEFRQRRRRRRLLIAATVLVLLIAGGFAARPTGRAIKGWQARRHAEQAFTFLAQENWSAARDSAIAAYQLRPTEPQALRAVARLLSRAGEEQAFGFWDELGRRAEFTQEDYRDQALIALGRGQIARAEAAVAKLMAEGGPAPEAKDWLLAGQLALQQGNVAAALSAAEKALANEAASERERLQASKMKLQISGALDPAPAEGVRSEAWRRISTLAMSHDAPGLEALLLLAQARLALPRENAPAENARPSPDQKSAPTDWSALELAETLERHPLGKAPQHLLAYDLRIYADASQAEPLIARAIEQWREGDTEAQVALARWLNARGQFQRHLDSIPLKAESAGRELLLHHLDALGSLNRWAEIKDLLASERFPLDPMIQQMYLARSSAQLGQKTAAENSWHRALEAAQGNAQKLMILGEYAEKNGAIPIAESAYSAVVAQAPKERPAQQGRLRMAQLARETKRMHAILEEMRQFWPNDTAVQNDEAYLRLLMLPADDSTKQEIEALASLAEALVQKEPLSLPHRTLLALARLKQGDPKAAIEVYQGIQVPRNAASLSALAVNAMVLSASGYAEAAQQNGRLIPPNSLLPEEEAGIAHLRETGP